MTEDFITALNYAIKEEIVDNYFRERRVIEEEIKLVVEAEAEAAEKGVVLDRALSSLKGLLAHETAWGMLWDSLGRSVPDHTFAPPGAHLAETIRGGLFWKGHYRRAVRQEALRTAQVWTEFQEALDQADKVAQEVNRDIERFHANFDFLLLRSVLGEMDPVMLEKKHFMGCSLDGCEIMDLDASLRFKPLKMPSTRLDIAGTPPRSRDIADAAQAGALWLLSNKPDTAHQLTG